MSKWRKVGLGIVRASGWAILILVVKGLYDIGSSVGWEDAILYSLFAISFEIALGAAIFMGLLLTGIIFPEAFSEEDDPEEDDEETND